MMPLRIGIGVTRSNNEKGLGLAAVIAAGLVRGGQSPSCDPRAPARPVDEGRTYIIIDLGSWKALVGAGMIILIIIAYTYCVLHCFANRYMAMDKTKRAELMEQAFHRPPPWAPPPAMELEVQERPKPQVPVQDPDLLHTAQPAQHEERARDAASDISARKVELGKLDAPTLKKVLQCMEINAGGATKDIMTETIARRTSTTSNQMRYLHGLTSRNKRAMPPECFASRRAASKEIDVILAMEGR